MFEEVDKTVDELLEHLTMSNPYYKDAVKAKRNNSSLIKIIGSFYHITRKDIATDFVVWKPKKIQVGDEPVFSRICVSPFISGAYLAIIQNLSPNSLLTVLKATNVRSAAKAFGVFDSKKTNECWLFKEVKFKNLGKIPKSISYDIYQEYVNLDQYSSTLESRFKNIVRRMLQENNLFRGEAI